MKYVTVLVLPCKQCIDKNQLLSAAQVDKKDEILNKW